MIHFILAIKVVILGFVLLPLEAKNIPELLLCESPTKNSTCVLRCFSSQTSNVVFYKETGSPAGEGACFIYSKCQSKVTRYIVYQKTGETYFRILNLDREMDEGNWFCEDGNERSKTKMLIVHTSISYLTIGPLPTAMDNGFNLTAEGYCVYPDIISARLLPSRGESTHTPIIKYTKSPKKCKPYEYSVLIFFEIKPTDYTGSVSFRVEVTDVLKITKIISDPTHQISFEDCIPPCALRELLTTAAIVCFFVVINILIKKRTKLRDLKNDSANSYYCCVTVAKCLFGSQIKPKFIILTVTETSISVCIIIFALNAVGKNYQALKDRQPGKEPACKCVEVLVYWWSLAFVSTLSTTNVIRYFQSVRRQGERDNMLNTNDERGSMLNTNGEMDKGILNLKAYSDTNHKLKTNEAIKPDAGKMNKTIPSLKGAHSEKKNNSTTNMEIKSDNEGKTYSKEDEGYGSLEPEHKTIESNVDGNVEYLANSKPSEKATK